MQKILIIGGTGYIGSALYPFLKDQEISIGNFDPEDYYELNDPNIYSSKYDVDTVDLEWFGNFVNPNNFILDYKDLTPEFLAKYDVVILLAGHSSVPMANNSDPNSTFKNNVDNFIVLLAKLRKGQKFIYAGSSSVYNGIPDDNVTEDYLLLNPANTYDMTKQDLDRYIKLFPEIEFYGLRFATVNGISENLRTDIMINAMVENAMQQQQVKLFNEHIRRPILHIQDLIRAIQAIIDCKEDKRGIYNLSSFNGTAGMIAEGVAGVVGVELKRVTQAEVEQAINSKLQAVYDFSISPKKFEDTFNFKFQGTIEIIANEVASHFTEIHKGKRLKAVKYR
jgi:nucleoside-diphosphate-sugar epimerase